MVQHKKGDPLIFVTGLSGAGMSTALDILEDMGYEVFDNFPLSLVAELLQQTQSENRKIAIGFDARTRGFQPSAVIEATQHYQARLMFMSCDDSVLQKRFTETRRRHPLAKDRPVSAGIKKEMAMLHDLRQHADPLIDTTDLSVHDLKRIIRGHIDDDRTSHLTVTVLSFGFKYGIPREADMMYDARFLRNPHWDYVLRAKTGQDQDVAAYIEEDDDLTAFVTKIEETLDILLPRYAAEGKSYFTLAMGCTGGKHRSVYLAERIGRWVQEKGIQVSVEHRDMMR